MNLRDLRPSGAARLFALLIASGVTTMALACEAPVVGDIDPPDALAETLVAACVPDCGGLACGDGGCADQPNACGTCGGDEACEAGLCVCQPDCSGRQCGHGGCPDQPGACGVCPAAAPICQADGACGVEPCEPDCAAAQCGDGGCADASDTTCGACGDGEVCAAGQCACVPDCADRACGDGGCPDRPDACGVCARGGTCSADGQCEACGPSDRDLIEAKGDAILGVVLECAVSCASSPACIADCVQAEVALPASCVDCYRGPVACVVDRCLHVCDDGDTGAQSCATCLRDARCLAELATCTGVEAACTPSCDGRECGHDGCFGGCAPGCDAPDACVDGRCVCTPDCAGKACEADDGCGGTCTFACPAEGAWDKAFWDDPHPRWAP